ncbi:DNA adenine methylase [Paenibacillus polymyxa]|uniref:DNA adenine methylase n=1 Tax=Paenibacillus polymyxa TaxID=1406 RepID=UPI0007EB7034|nr:DNA adenine methylase [Paenibacillus polymyxa]OAZ44856.1 DNA methyltransferase [Paenibacillus polymyxa]
MPVTDTPLRYPGGKTQLFKFISNLLMRNNLSNSIYVEPFSGGAGISISLLLRGLVDKIVINDIDPSIHAFWYSILNYCEQFISLIENTDVTMESWNRQKEINEIYRNNPYSIENGFSTFFLNRTNRSGIISGGVIGGRNQEGKYKLDCRYNKQSLIKKIRNIASMYDNITLYNIDAKILIDQHIKHLDPNRTFVFFDPPYYKQGKNLYTNSFGHQDHVALYKAIKQINNYHWITTYDYHQAIIDIYKDVPQYKYSLQYSAQNKRKERELLFSNVITSVESFSKIIIEKA